MRGVLRLPYLLFTWSTWNVLRWVRRETPFDELLPGILVGRRLFPRELPGDVSLVVDPTSEFTESHAIRIRGQYLAVPTLDMTAPDLPLLIQTVDTILAHSGSVFVHCAGGHGLTRVIAACVLLKRGLCWLNG